jgi:glyoxylase-like metal-dependent hydrolase (beta-lactamase superfamily II)
MRMHILRGGHLRMRRSVYFADAPREQTIDLPVSCYLLRHPRGNVLFDTGCHPLTGTDPVARWGGATKVMTPLHGPQDHVVAALADLGLVPDDIDLVVNSHLHTDHCGCNAYFRRATVVCQAQELEAARSDEGPRLGMAAQDWDHPVQFRTFEDSLDLFDDGRIVLMHLPGHTPGMCCALLGLTHSGPHLLASDAVALRAHLEQGSHPRQTWSLDQADRSMDRIRALQAQGVEVIFGHDLEQWQGLRRGTAYYD